MSASSASPSSGSAGRSTGSVSGTGTRDHDHDFSDRDHNTGGSAQLASRPRHENTTETKAAFKTTEFIAYVAVLAGILIAGLVENSSGESGFNSQEVWLYAAILTVGYMISRGLAKSGSYESDNAGR